MEVVDRINRNTSNKSELVPKDGTWIYLEEVAVHQSHHPLTLLSIDERMRWPSPRKSTSRWSCRIAIIRDLRSSIISAVQGT